MKLQFGAIDSNGTGKTSPSKLPGLQGMNGTTTTSNRESVANGLGGQSLLSKFSSKPFLKRIN